MSDRPPPDWDRLGEPPAPALAPEPPPRAQQPPLLLAAWADLALLLGGSALALAAVRLSGYPTALAGVPWALASAASWWIAAALVLLSVRRATPGMLLVGVAFRRALPPGRLARTMAAALLSSLLLGLPALLPGAALVERAAGASVEVS